MYFILLFSSFIHTNKQQQFKALWQPYALSSLTFNIPVFLPQRVLNTLCGQSAEVHNK